jgi:capsular polysaccharide biosynthesis protein
LGTQLTKDYAELISSRYVIEEVIQKLQLDLDYKALCNKIAVSTPSDTRIVSITVEDSDPVAAMNIANAVRESASFHIKNVMDIDAVNIVETANMPTSKASPNNFRWLVIGGMLGAFFVIVIVLIRYLTDDTIKSTDDIEKYLGLSTLGIIPVMQEEYDGEKKKKRLFNRPRKA